MEGELIFLGFIMLAGQIIMLMMWQNNWFKKENFKIKKSNILAQNKLQFRKLEKELGLIPSKQAAVIPPKSTLSQLSDLAPLLKNLDSDQIGNLIDVFLGGGGEAAEGGGGLLDNIPPELIESFIKGLKGGKETQQETPIFPEQ